MTPRLDYHTIEGPDPNDLAPVDRGLHDYNLAHVGEAVVSDYHRVAVIVRDGQGDVGGGIYGELVWEWLHIDTLWVAAHQRGVGVGSELLRRLESVAVRKGFVHAHLETTSFQALGFYQRHGYEIFGVLEGKPKGVTWYYLKKTLGS